MDSNFAIKPRPSVQNFKQRSPTPQHDAAETEVDAAKSVAAVGDARDEPREQHGQRSGPLDVAVDPESRDVINRENDIRARDDHRQHPDQALLRFRAYRPADIEPKNPPPGEPHANIKA
jgi:hypothetical protein